MLRRTIAAGTQRGSRCPPRLRSRRCVPTSVQRRHAASDHQRLPPTAHATDRPASKRHGATKQRGGVFMILISGATGHVGAAITRILVEAGEPVRGLVRDTGRQGLDPRASWVEADLKEPSTVIQALPGSTAMFVMAGYPGLP